MQDGFETTFVVDLDADAVWEALTSRSIEREGSSPEAVHYVLPGFPSFVPLPVPGASCIPIEINAGRLLRLRKEDEPCRGTEIAVTLEAVEAGTRITVVQSGFGPWLEDLRDTFDTGARQIFADFRLFIERGITVPSHLWEASLGAQTKQTPTGLEITTVVDGGFGASAGMQPGDLLLTLRGVRIHDTQQLWTVLALSKVGSHAEATWARGREWMCATATL